MIGDAAIMATASRYLVRAETVKDSSLLVWDRTPARLWLFCLVCCRTHMALVSQSPGQRLASVLICLAEAVGKQKQNAFQVRCDERGVGPPPADF
jgi:hypothetical protein